MKAMFHPIKGSVRTFHHIPYNNLELSRLGINLNWIPDAGHHIYADQAAIFNNAVKKALS